MTNTALQTTNDEENEVFYPEFMKQLGLKGFVLENIEAKTIHLKGLFNSIKDKGYDPEEPIIAARCSDPSIQGFVLDGRHRLIACSWIEKEKGEAPTITVRYEKVADLDHAELRQAAYEAQHLNKKTAESAAEHIISIYERVKLRTPELIKERSLDEFVSKECKIADSAMASAVVRLLQRHERNQSQKTIQASALRVNPTTAGSWSSTKQSEAAGPLKPQDPYKMYAVEVEVPASEKKRNLALNVKIFASGKAEAEIVA